ncbi:DUF3427 domain-containing protein [Cellulomonas cellasea]|uniref:Protein NO VEIN C-terminal domain-containing protein n=1 Tax=Cellulomonas cellasea TaxID=43670 RepID=A0A7W4YBT5_9CELL|nr:DUF3427 domain-containing protein [Cellulomonas cellasea]MBB2924008.1 hypothetical protein [Cellulomonas cellasea]
MRQLNLWEAYTRREAHDIFEPATTFTPQTGKWGLPGIVRLAENDGDFVFFVTFGATAGGHDFDEEITEDGVLTWQSQPGQRLHVPTIQKLIAHDDLAHSIHLFLRTSKATPAYTYFGKLGYLDHDPTREAPVYFTWQLLDWPAPDGLLTELGLSISPSTEAVPPVADGTLVRTDPPTVSTPSSRGSTPGGRKHATLPGQDARNARLGAAGEELVLKHERKRLIEAGRADLSDAVVHTSVVEGDAAGYDIRSYHIDGSDRHIEVKTTRGPASNAFFISPNELAFSAAHPESYVIIRIFGYDYKTDSGRFYEVNGSVFDAFDLAASEFRARLRADPAPVPRQIAPAKTS